ncbi:MAG: carbon-nitrogen hydrolase family protein [Thermoplasmatota archaeon]
MKLTVAQKKHSLGDKQHNLDIIKNTAESTKSDLLVFPEMFLTGYSLRDQLWDEAEEIPGPSSSTISKLAVENNMNIICGMPEKKKNNGRLYNSALLASSDGEIHVYRKSYLANFGPFDEMRYFKPDNNIEVFDTPIGKIGIVICYDLFFPELTKSMALQGSEIIVCISASPSTSRKFFEKVLPARAIETTNFMIYSNLVGREDDMVFWGGDQVISPKGFNIAKGKYYEEYLLNVKIDENTLQEARRGRPALSDTRPQIMYNSADSSIR